MQRPSPAMVVALIALVVACSGTAVAAGVLITSSSQIRDGVITSSKLRGGAVTGSKIANRAITGKNVARGSLGADLLANRQIGTDKLTPDAVRALSSSGTQAFEYFRKTGPETQPSGGSSRVLTADNVPTGVYAIFAKTIITDLNPPSNFLQIGPTADGHCELGAGGDLDDGRVLIGTGIGSGPGDVFTQITHTFSGPGTITLTCDADATWRASDSTIIAVRLGNASRVELPG